MFISNPFIINLDSAPDRWSTISESLAKLNIPYNRFPGIDGRKLTSDELAKYTKWFNRTFTLTHSIIGCALSHYFVLPMARAQLPSYTQTTPDTTWILVLEDDAVITDNYTADMAKLHTDLEWLHRMHPEEYDQIDILKLCIPTRHLPSAPVASIFLELENRPAIDYTKEGAMHYKFRSYYLAAHNTAYLVKLSSVDKIINQLHTRKINTHIDMELGFRKEIGIYYVDHPIIDSKVDNFNTSTNLANTYPRSSVWATFALNQLGLLSTYTTFGIIQPGAGFNLYYKIANIWLIFLAIVLIIWLIVKVGYSAEWNPWPYIIIYWIADTILFYRT